MAAVGKRDVRMLIGEIDDERLNFLEHLSTWSTFGVGWGRRVASVKNISLHMAASAAAAPATIATPVPAAHVATPDMPMAKAAAAPSDLLSHLTDAADWLSTWNKISSFAGSVA